MAGTKSEQQAAIFKRLEDQSNGKKSLGRGKSEQSFRISVVKYVTESWKAAMFLVLMALSNNFTVRVQSVVLMVNTISLAENVDSQACVSVL